MPAMKQRGFFRHLRNKFVAGLLILIPIVITFQALWWLFIFVDEMAQPLATSAEGKPADRPEVVVAGPVRRKLADERHSLTHKFGIAGHKGYITVGLYEDGSPGEVFITMAKEGSTIGRIMDSFGTALSIAL